MTKLSFSISLTGCGFQQRLNHLLMSPLSRYVSPQSQVAHNGIYHAVGPAGSELITTASSNNSLQTDVLMRENERLRKELEVYMEKAARLQKVREDGVINSTVGS